jgi:hypothetical protein
MKTHITKKVTLTTTENAAIRFALLNAIEFNAKHHYDFFTPIEAAVIEDVYELLSTNTRITITATNGRKDK